jgi:hypothetical protein
VGSASDGVGDERVDVSCCLIGIGSPPGAGPTILVRMSA